VDVILSTEEKTDHKSWGRWSRASVIYKSRERVIAATPLPFTADRTWQRKRDIVEITTLLATPKRDLIYKQPGTRPGDDKMTTCYILQDLVENLKKNTYEREDTHLG